MGRVAYPDRIKEIAKENDFNTPTKMIKDFLANVPDNNDICYRRVADKLNIPYTDASRITDYLVRRQKLRYSGWGMRIEKAGTNA